MGPPADPAAPEEPKKTDVEDEATPALRTPSSLSETRPVPTGLLNKSGGPARGGPVSGISSKAARLATILEKGAPTQVSGSVPKGRNLVVCIDGTSNQFGNKNTNVIKLYSAVDKSNEIEQLCYYNSGIGTYAEPSFMSWAYVKQYIDNTIDLAIAWNFEKIIYGAYRWLSDNWKEHDRIYLFGFSRGAYQVRALAGMIHKVGLLYPGNAEQIPFAYELYSKEKENVIIEKNLKASGSKTDDATARSVQTSDLAKNFKKTFCRKNVRVHFIGAWDTVSSIGIIRWKSLPLTDTADHVTYFRHALALDERRVKFLPEYVNGGACDGGTGRRPHEEGGLEHVKEVWFPGTHSDIGGGNFLNPDLTRETAPYLWMATEAASCGLKLELAEKTEWEKRSETQESLRKLWHILEYLPFPILTYKDSTSMHYGPHRGEGRKILPKQKLHPSIAYQPNYTPRADLRSAWKDRDWPDLAGKGLGDSADSDWKANWHGRLEDDLSNINELIDKLRTCDAQDEARWKYRLSALTLSVPACQILLKHIADIVLLFETKARLSDSKLGFYVIGLIEKVCQSQPSTNTRACAVRTWLLSAARNLPKFDEQVQAIRCLACSLSTGRKITVKNEEIKFKDSFEKLIKETNLVLVKDTKAVSNTTNARTSLRSVLDRVKDEILATSEGVTKAAQNSEATQDLKHQSNDGTKDVKDVLDGTFNRRNLWLHYARSWLINSIQRFYPGLPIWAKGCHLSRELLDPRTLDEILNIQPQGSIDAERTRLIFCFSAIEHGALNPEMCKQVLDYVCLVSHAFLPPLRRDEFEVQRRLMAFLSATTGQDATQLQLWNTELLNALPTMLSSSDIEVQKATLDALALAMENEVLKDADFTAAMISAIRDSLWSSDRDVRQSAFRILAQAVEDGEIYGILWKGSTAAQIRENLSSRDSGRKQMSFECLSSAVKKRRETDASSAPMQPTLDFKELVYACLVDDSDVQCYALNFYGVAARSVFWEYFWDAEAITRIEGLLQSFWSSWITRQHTIQCITSTLGNASLFERILDQRPDLVAGLGKQLFADSDEDVRESIALFFKAAGQLNDSLFKRVWTGDVVERIKTNLSSISWWRRQQSVDTVTVVIEETQPREIILGDDNLIELLFEAIWDSDVDVRQSTFSFFKKATELNVLNSFWSEQRVARTKSQLSIHTEAISVLSLLLPLILDSGSMHDTRWFSDEEVQLVLDNLTTGGGYRRTTALEVLETVAREATLSPLLWKPRVAVLLEKMLDDTEPDVRRATFSCLRTAVLQEHLQVYLKTEHLVKLLLRHIACQSCSNEAEIMTTLQTLTSQERLSENFLFEHTLPLLKQIILNGNNNARVSALGFLASMINERHGFRLLVPEIVQDIRGLRLAREPDVRTAFWTLLSALAGQENVEGTHASAICEQLLPTEDIMVIFGNVATGTAEQQGSSGAEIERLLSINHFHFQERLIACLGGCMIQAHLREHVLSLKPFDNDLVKIKQDAETPSKTQEGDIFAQTGVKLLEDYLTIRNQQGIALDDLVRYYILDSVNQALPRAMSTVGKKFLDRVTKKFTKRDDIQVPDVSAEQHVALPIDTSPGTRVVDAVGLTEVMPPRSVPNAASEDGNIQVEPISSEIGLHGVEQASNHNSATSPQAPEMVSAMVAANAKDSNAEPVIVDPPIAVLLPTPLKDGDAPDTMAPNPDEIDIMHLNLTRQDSALPDRSVVEGDEISIQKTDELGGSDREKLAELRSKLNPVLEASYTNFAEDQRTACLNDTRVRVISYIEDWVHGRLSDAGKQIFVLEGGAGVGKSAIAQTIAERTAKTKTLCASYFFRGKDSPEGSKRTSPEQFLHTMIYQLACYADWFAEEVSKELNVKGAQTSSDKSSENPVSGVLSQQLLFLIANPFRHRDASLQGQISEQGQPMLVVIDALDECEEAETLIETLVSHIGAVPQLKLFVTTRPERGIREILKKHRKHQCLQLDDIDERIVQSDIRSYLSFSLSPERVEKLHPYVYISRLDTKQMATLSGMCGRIFLIASAIRDFLLSEKEFDRQLSRLLNNADSLDLLDAVNKMYARPLASITGREIGIGWFDNYRIIIGSIAIIDAPINLSALAALLGINKETIENFLPPFYSLLAPSGPDDSLIRVCHKSFSAFITSPARIEYSLAGPLEAGPLVQKLQIDLKTCHSDLAKGCLVVMKEQLVTNANHGASVQLNWVGGSDIRETEQIDGLSSELQYATRYWAFHLRASRCLCSALKSELELWTSTCLFAWLGTIYQLDHADEAPKILQDALSAVATLEDESWKEWINVRKCLSDALDFVTQSQNILKLGPRQIRMPGLPFIPPQSVLHSCYGGAGVVRVFGIEQTWDHLVATLYMHAGSVRALSFSPDSQRLATASTDKTVILWEIQNGKFKSVAQICHADWVNAVAFSPDGLILASASDDKTVKFWNVKKSESQSQLFHTDSVRAISFTSNGANLASASDDKTVRVWNVIKGTNQCTLQGHNDCVTSVKFSHDDTILASASYDNTVRIWDWAQGTLLTTLTAHLDRVRVLSFSPNSATLASASEDGTIHVWIRSSTQFTHSRTLKGHSSSVSTIAFSPDGSTLASASDDKTVKLWDWMTSNQTHSLIKRSGRISALSLNQAGAKLTPESNDYPGSLWAPKTRAPATSLRASDHGRFRTIQFSKDGSLMASICGPNRIAIWEGRTISLVRTIENIQGDRINAIAIAPDGLSIACASYNSLRILWIASQGTQDIRLDGHSDWVNAVVFSPDGSSVVSASDDGTVIFWEAKSGQILATEAPGSSSMRVLEFSRDGSKLASGSSFGEVILWRMNSGHPTLMSKLEGHSDIINAVSFSQNSPTLASASDDNLIILWDADSGTRITNLAGHTGSVRAIAWSPGGSRIASASTDNTVRIWEVGNGESLSLSGHTGPVLDISFSQSGSRLASASADGTIRLWDGIIGEHIATFVGHTLAVNAVSFSPSDLVLASASDDETVKLWHEITPSSSTSASDAGHNASSHRGWVAALAFRPDVTGSRIASASSDRTIGIWDTETGVQIASLVGHSDWINDIEFSPDGTKLASVSDDKTVMVWNGDIGSSMYIQKHHSTRIQAICISSDGTKYASVSGDMISLWNGVTGSHLTRFPNQHHDESIHNALFSPDGQILASTSGDTTIILRKLASSKTAILKGQLDHISTILFRPDNSELASGSNDGTVRLWDLANWDVKEDHEYAVRVGHKGPVTALAFSSVYEVLASASDDIRVWQKSGSCDAILIGRAGRVDALMFSSDGLKLVSASQGRKIHLWDLKASALITSVDGVSSLIKSMSTPPNHAILASITIEQAMELWERVASHKAFHDPKSSPISFSFLPRHSSGKGKDSNTPTPYPSIVPECCGILAVRREQPPASELIAIRLPSEGGCLGASVCWFPAYLDVTVVTVSPDGSKVVVGCRDGRVLLLDISAIPF